MNDELYDWMILNAPNWAIKKLKGERTDAARAWREAEKAEKQLEAVRPYLMHRDGCVWDVQDDPYGCTCGLRKALEGDE